MKNLILAMLLVVGIFGTIFAVNLPVTVTALSVGDGTACIAAGGECKNSCSASYDTQLGEDKNDCGKRGWFWKAQKKCCDPKPCADGTEQLACSTTKPKWCNIKMTLKDDPERCGCPDGQVKHKYQNKCVTSAPTTPLPAAYCTFMLTGVACGSAGGTCQNGACVTPTPSPVSTPISTPVSTATATPFCSDTDKTGSSTKVLGTRGTCTSTGSTTCAPGSTTCTDACVNSQTLKEYYCTASKSCHYSNEGCPSGKTCVDGACVPTTSIAASCADTDTTAQGPGAYGSKGTCTDAGPSAVCPNGCPDTCTSGNENKVGGTLKEYYCSSSRCYSTFHSCTSAEMCSAGQCVPKTAATSAPTTAPTAAPTAAGPTCTDSDTTTPNAGPGHYDTAGTCTDSGSSSVCPDGCPDVCATSSTLKEYYCWSNRCYLKQESCSSGKTCSNGACVPV